MGVFEKYDEALLEILEGKSTKETVAAFGRTPALDLDGKAIVKKLLACIESAWASSPTKAAQNWVWRGASFHSPTTEEVGLERLIVQRGGAHHWSYQMSTTSGVGAWSAKRCAIDLVRDYGGGHFAFIELKVRSDDPIHAAFEILRYYLAYVVARRGLKHEEPKPHDVLKASRIDLVVLAPTGWYVYPVARGKRVPLELGWFASQLSAGAQAVAPKGVEVAFHFKSFDGGLNRDERANEIVRIFSVAGPMISA